MCYFLGLTRQQPDVILNHVMFEINYLFEISFSRMPVDRVVTKISSCRVNTTSRRGIKRLGISFGSIFLLFSKKSSRGPLS